MGKLPELVASQKMELHGPGVVISTTPPLLNEASGSFQGEIKAQSIRFSLLRVIKQDE